MSGKVSHKCVNNKKVLHLQPQNTYYFQLHQSVSMICNEHRFVNISHLSLRKRTTTIKYQALQAEITATVEFKSPSPNFNFFMIFNHEKHIVL